MKQASPSLYDKKYFSSKSPDFSKKVKIKFFQKKYNEIANMVNLTSNDTICDYGCGGGDLSFVLSLKYDCSIIGIDYSKSAIDICQKKLKLFNQKTKPNSKIKFLNKNNNEIPKLKKIKAVFFCDVFEHLYDHEIALIIKQISKWNKISTIIIHTDNNRYLNYIKPLIDLLKIFFKKTTFQKIKNQTKNEKKRHVNLINPQKLSQKMSKFGYKLIKIKYPKLEQKTIKTQLESLSIFKPLIFISFFFLRIFPFLNPSFYAIYKKN